VVDVYICKLRKKLAAHTSGGCYIETVYGRGYKLDAPSAASLPDMAEDIIEEAEPKRAVG
jgi:two-component system cell cycle response regulator CtrA